MLVYDARWVRCLSVVLWAVAPRLGLTASERLPTCHRSVACTEQAADDKTAFSLFACAFAATDSHHALSTVKHHVAGCRLISQAWPRGTSCSLRPLQYSFAPQYILNPIICVQLLPQAENAIAQRLRCFRCASVRNVQNTKRRAASAAGTLVAYTRSCIECHAVVDFSCLSVFGVAVVPSAGFTDSRGGP